MADCSSRDALTAPRLWLPYHDNIMIRGGLGFKQQLNTNYTELMLDLNQSKFTDVILANVVFQWWKVTKYSVTFYSISMLCSSVLQLLFR